MPDYKITLSLTKLGKALESLEQITAKPNQPDRSNIDAAIQRLADQIFDRIKTYVPILRETYNNIRGKYL
jgi:hypothetical protein